LKNHSTMKSFGNLIKSSLLLFSCTLLTNIARTLGLDQDRVRRDFGSRYCLACCPSRHLRSLFITTQILSNSSMIMLWWYFF
jgi:hypothetical protein